MIYKCKKGYNDCIWSLTLTLHFLIDSNNTNNNKLKKNTKNNKDNTLIINFKYSPSCTYYDMYNSLSDIIKQNNINLDLNNYTLNFKKTKQTTSIKQRSCSSCKKYNKICKRKPKIKKISKMVPVKNMDKHLTNGDIIDIYIYQEITKYGLFNANGKLLWSFDTLEQLDTSKIPCYYFKRSPFFIYSINKLEDKIKLIDVIHSNEKIYNDCVNRIIMGYMYRHHELC